MIKQGIKAYFTREEFLQSLDKAWFFVIRSSNFENIQISTTYGEWATTKANEGKLNEAEKLEGDALEAQTKLLKNEVNEASISTVKKTAFRDKINELNKKVVALKKQKAAGMKDEIVAKAVEAAEAASGNKVVVRFDFE